MGAVVGVGVGLGLGGGGGWGWVGLGVGWGCGSLFQIVLVPQSCPAAWRSNRKDTRFGRTALGWGGILRWEALHFIVLSESVLYALPPPDPTCTAIFVLLSSRSYDLTRDVLTYLALLGMIALAKCVLSRPAGKNSSFHSASIFV